MTLKAKLDLWSPNKHFHLIPWPQKPIKNGIICYSEILHFSNMAAGGHLEFWKMLNDDSVLSLGILIYTYKRIRKCNKTLYGLSSEVGQKIKRLPTDYTTQSRLKNNGLIHLAFFILYNMATPPGGWLDNSFSLVSVVDTPIPWNSLCWVFRLLRSCLL